jgi:hypothetical protein
VANSGDFPKWMPRRDEFMFACWGLSLLPVPGAVKRCPKAISQAAQYRYLRAWLDDFPDCPELITSGDVARRVAMDAYLPTTKIRKSPMIGEA